VTQGVSLEFKPHTAKKGEGGKGKRKGWERKGRKRKEKEN
jgi:hypothetical protein